MIKELYWRIRSFTLTVVFKIKSIIYKISNYLYRKRIELNLKRSLPKELVKRVVFGFLLFVFTYKLDGFVDSLFDIPVLKMEVISDILIAMVGIAGVFLGLYCSYIATVFSSKYINAPHQISELFKNDLLNSNSILSITNYIVYSITVILFNLLSFDIGVITISINLAMAIYMVVSYVFIGKHILSMSDTYSVATSVYRDILRDIKKITNSNMFIKDASFQNHSKKLVCQSVEKLNLINSYNRQFSDSKVLSMYDFMKNNLALIENYLMVKAQIPHDSVWFLTTEYKKWYSANDSEIGIALNTGTSLGVNKAYDYYWFEKEILKINELCVDKLIETHSYDLLRRYIGCFEVVLSTAVKTNTVHFFTDYVISLQKKTQVILSEGDEKLKTDTELSMVEAVVMLCLQCVIDIKKHCKSLSIKDILDGAVNCKIKRNSNLHSFINHEDIRRIYDGVSVEKTIEGQRITPDWFIKQSVSKHIYNELVLYCKTLDIVVNHCTIDFANNLFDAKRYASATLIYSKHIELYHKAMATLPVLKERISETKSYHLETKNYPWDQYDFDTLASQMNKVYNDIPAKWSKCATIFTVQNWDNYNDFPDMLGLCYNNICNYLIQTLATDDFESFKSAYECIWGLVVLYQELSKKELSQIKEPYKQDAVLMTLCNPILDFGYISGYAYLWGEISSNKEWQDLVVSSFDKMMDNQKEGKLDLCVQISTMLSIPSKLMPGIYNRSLIHTSWKQTMLSVFSNSKHLKWQRKGFEEVLDTDSQLLKKLFGTKSSFDYMMIEAYDVFAVLVLNKHLPDDKKFLSKWGWENEIL